MGGDVLLASRWEAGWDIAYLVWGLIRVAFSAGPDWIRYPVLGLGIAFILYTVGPRCRDWWRERRSPPPEVTETSLDT